MRKNLLKITLGFLAILTMGCAGRIDGELDGQEVPGFSSASFGVADGQQLDFIFAFATEDSCSDGAELLRISEDQVRARTEQDLADVNERMRDWMNARPIDSWFTLVTLGAAEESDFRDELVDLSDEAPVISTNFTVCRRKREARIRDGVLEDGNDCYRAADGDLRFRRDSDDVLSLESDGSIKYVDSDGDTAGRVDMSFTFQRCDALDDAGQDVIDAFDAR